MALWDSLGKKASETTAKAVQQARILSETAKLNSLISDEDKRINNYYYQIGKLYATIHQNDCEDDFKGMIAAIVESEQKIKEYRVQIHNIKGVVHCEKCGAEVAKGAAFCSSCGAEMPKIENSAVDNTEKCSNCGAVVEKGMRFCTSCGKPMIALEATNSNQTEAVAPKHVCPNCGVELEDDVIFCSECGTKV